MKKALPLLLAAVLAGCATSPARHLSDYELDQRLDGMGGESPPLGYPSGIMAPEDQAAPKGNDLAGLCELAKRNPKAVSDWALYRKMCFGEIEP